MISTLCKTTFWTIFVLAAGVGITSTVLCFKKYKTAAILVIFAAAVSLICQSVYYRYDEIGHEFFANTSGITAEVISYSEPTSSGRGVSVRAKLENGDRPVRAIIYAYNDKTELVPGDIIVFDGKIYPLENTEYFAEKTYYKSRYIDVRVMTDSVTLSEKSEGVKLKYFPAYLAKLIKDKIDEIYPEKTAAFIKSLILGDKSGLSDDFGKNLSATGLAHAVSVSGLHISIIVGFLILFTKNRYLKLLAVPVIFLFAILVGAPQSAMRAVIMQTFVLVSTVWKREYDTLTAISVAAFILVAINPYCATDTAFLLSFFATLGIVVLNPKIFAVFKPLTLNDNRIVRRMLFEIFGGFSVSLSAAISTAPILAYTFGKVSVIAPVVNALLNIFITFDFVAGFIIIILGFISVSLAKGVGVVVNIVTMGIINVINAAGRLPFAEVFTGDPTLIILICFICFVLVYAIAVGKSRMRLWFSALVIALSAACVIICTNLLVPVEKVEGIRFDVLDVGQGQCVVATSGDMCAVIDCGGDKEADHIAISHLLKNRIDDIDAMILTHAHADHANGAGYLADTIPTEAVYMPSTDRENATFINLAKQADDECKVIFVENDMTVELGDMKIDILTLPPGNDENENGIVVIVRDGEYETLITGDIPSQKEKLVLDRVPDCESYIVGHHGSKSSSSQALLNKALPELSVISVGVGNSYGHPSSETLRRIKSIGSVVMRTDVDGTVTFYSRQQGGVES